MKIEALVREFSYNGVALVDPGPNLSPEQVRDMYSAAYPEITSAVIEGPERKADKLVYLTDSRGVTDQAGELLDAITADEADDLIKDGEWLSTDLRRYLPCSVRATQARNPASR